MLQNLKLPHFFPNNELPVIDALIDGNSCPIFDYIYAPQECFLEFGSWTYDESQLVLNWWMDDENKHEIPFIDFNDYVQSNEWETDGEEEGKKLPRHIRKKQIKSIKFMYNTTNLFGNM